MARRTIGPKAMRDIQAYRTGSISSVSRPEFGPGPIFFNIPTHGAVLDWVRFSDAKLKNVDFGKAQLRNVYFSGCELDCIDFLKADLQSCLFDNCTISGSYFHESNCWGVVFHDCVINRASFCKANLTEASFRGGAFRNCSFKQANLAHVNFTDTTFRDCDWSESKGLLDAAQWLRDTFECDDLGIIVYKAIGETFKPRPLHWQIAPGSFLEEVVNFDRFEECGCGVNFGTRAWITQNLCRHTYSYDIWRCRIRWTDLPGVVVPYNTDGKARCSRLELLRIVE
jgi:hypothetical protein